MRKITPFLWFDDNAEEAVDFYTSTFANSKKLGVSRYGEGGRGVAGKVMTVTFSLDGQELIALNGGPYFKFTPAISLFVACETQDEIDRLWDKLLEGGGAASQCGWLTDRYGLSWQIVPRILNDLIQDADAAKARRTTQAMLKMIKLDIAALVKAHAGS